MHIVYEFLFPAMWVAFIAYWWIMARGAKPAERLEPLVPRVLRVVYIAGAVALLWLPKVPIPDFDVRLWPSTPPWFWAGVLVTAAGLSFAVWARHYLGGNWSQAVTVKEDHQLVTSGPYGIVRHPIYTGFLLGFAAGCALAIGEVRGLVAVALVLVVLVQKLLLEEKWMAEEFGDDYRAYRRRVRALVPFVV